MVEHIEMHDENNQINHLLTELHGRRYGYARSSSMQSLANLISLNEAIYIFSQIQNYTNENSSDLKERIREGHSRTLALGQAQDRTNISPFNPPDNFYVWAVHSGKGPLIIEALGRNINEVLWNIIQYIIEHVYEATIQPSKYKSHILDKQGNQIGELYFAKEKGNQTKTCLIGRVRTEKRIDKILARYETRGFLIKVIINCPEHVKQTIHPHLKKMETKLINLIKNNQFTNHLPKSESKNRIQDVL